MVSGEGNRRQREPVCVCELEAVVATGACQELTMTCEKNLDFDDKSSNRETQALLGTGTLN